MMQRFLRVDHAGEVGANDIYAGQMAVLGRSKDAPIIRVSTDLDIQCRLSYNEYIRKLTILRFL